MAFFFFLLGMGFWHLLVLENNLTSGKYNPLPPTFCTVNQWKSFLSISVFFRFKEFSSGGLWQCCSFSFYEFIFFFPSNWLCILTQHGNIHLVIGVSALSVPAKCMGGEEWVDLPWLEIAQIPNTSVAKKASKLTIEIGKTKFIR